MDGQKFDSFTRSIASGLSRRRLLGSMAGGTGAGLLSALGFVTRGTNAQGDSGPELLNPPKVKFEGLDTVIELELSERARCIIEYGTTKEFGKKLESEKSLTEHKMVVRDLAPETHYYFRAELVTNKTRTETESFEFNTPACPDGSSRCGDKCVANCGTQAHIDETCTCVCDPGFGDCDGDPGNGCETALNTTENCLACGNNCDDGNACTDNVCDPVNGCVSTNVTDGTACGSAGVCQAGVCASCVGGGTCQADAECCDDESCCNGTCVAKASLLDDVENCGACGNVCPSSPCQNAICAEGVCQTAPSPDGDTCDDGDPCTVNDHCMAGGCMGGSEAEDGTECGDGGICTSGFCVECAAGGSCEGDSECCAGELCCEGTCIAEDSLDDDVANCGACGNVCEDKPCYKVTCKDGECQEKALADGTECGQDGICTDGVCEEIDVVTQAAGTVFEDNFESGSLSKWSSSSGIKIQSDLVADGEFSARATGKRTVSYARKSLGSAYTNIYARTRFQIVSQGKNSVYLLRAYKSSSAPLLSVFVSSSGRLSLFNNVTGATTTSSTVVSKGIWYDIQMRVKVVGNKSLGWVWLDGVRVDDISKTTDLGSAGVNLVQLGDNVTGRTFDVVFDDMAICNGDLCPAVTPITSVPGESTAPGAASGALLASYAHNGKGGVSWSKVWYKPRQFNNGLVIADPTRGNLKIDDAETYAGWDVFLPYNYSVHRAEKRSDWIVLDLNRPSTLAIVWRGGSTVPTWLSSWTKSGNVKAQGKTYPTYKKSLAAGKVTLGAVYNPTDNPGPNVTRDTYWVLMAEKDGLRSPAPTVPGGKEVPTPNATCPTWVHDQYVAIGPDGAAYPTWHHLIDPVYWCYHRHEHGTNPANFDSSTKPVFGYTATKHGMTEPHPGFKTFVFDSKTGTRWMVTQHFGTAGLGRACTRFHTADIVVKSIATGELLADLHIMGDFGRSVVNSTDVVLRPPTCPDQAALAAQDGSTGIRKLPSQADGPAFYEPWRVDLKKTVFGFLGDFTINNPDGMVICNNSTCDKAVTTGNSGTKRFFTPNRSVRNEAFGISAAKNNGVFYTDPSGRKLVKSGDAGAVKQFIKAGAKFTAEVAGHCYDVNAWGKMLDCNASDAPPTSREGSVQAPN